MTREGEKVRIHLDLINPVLLQVGTMSLEEFIGEDGEGRINNPQKPTQELVCFV